MLPMRKTASLLLYKTCWEPGTISPESWKLLENDVRIIGSGSFKWCLRVIRKSLELFLMLMDAAVDLLLNVILVILIGCRMAILSWMHMGENIVDLEESASHTLPLLEGVPQVWIQTSPEFDFGDCQKSWFPRIRFLEFSRCFLNGHSEITRRGTPSKRGRGCEAFSSRPIYIYIYIYISFVINDHTTTVWNDENDMSWNSTRMNNEHQKSLQVLPDDS